MDIMPVNGSFDTPIPSQDGMGDPAAPAQGAKTPESDADKQKQRNLVTKILKNIAKDRNHHAKAYERMRRDMAVARNGHDKDWSTDNYVANVTGRIVRQKTAALYAKNPKAVARRPERLDFKVWDENPDTLMMAFQTIQQAAQQVAMGGMPGGPMGMPGAPSMGAPQPLQGLPQAQATLADFQQGIALRQQIDRIGKTLEILYAHALRNQQPLDFKTAMKKVVRRACTTGVAYVELGFQRDYGAAPEILTQMTDTETRLSHLRELAEDAQDGEISGDDPEIAELEDALTALIAQPQVVSKEGLVFDYPPSTKVIPDRLCKSLAGFVGSRHVTVEYDFTSEQVEEMFPDADLEQGFTPFRSSDDEKGVDLIKAAADDVTDMGDKRGERPDMVRVYKYYDKPSGMVYFVAEGYKDFLRTPAPPDVYVTGFWPIFALTFNDVESEDDLFPPSDVQLVHSMQDEYNRSRQGKREHRKAARPRWFYQNGVFDKDDIETLSNAEPFSASPLNLPPDKKLADVMGVAPVPGVDPNLYDTGELFNDVQLVVGQQQATLGGLAKATATESAIAAGSTANSDESSVDDLDAFLTVLARASGQVLMREMSEQTVVTIVGPGALWPTGDLMDVANEMYLEVEAGSSGKPNQAVEINNWQKILPFLLQIPGINPTWLARETIKRLDDKVDLTQAIAAGMASIVMQNTGMAPHTANPMNDPAMQGAQGAQNGPPPPADHPGGSGPAFGSNQVQ